MVAGRHAQDSTGPGPSNTFLPTSPRATSPRPGPNLPPDAVWPIGGFPLQNVQAGRPLDLIYSIFALHFIGEETKGRVAPVSHSEAGSYF